MTLIIEKEQQQQEQLTPACEGKTELFFSERTRDMRAAQTICSGCSVRQSCLESARSNPPFAGVWGGVIFVNGEELLTKRGRGRPAKSEQLDNARVLKALAAKELASSDEGEEQDSNRELVQQIA